MSDQMRKRISGVFIAIFFFVMGSSAQNEYLYDIGIGGGLSGYTGDVSSNLIKPLSSNLNAFYRYNFNNRFSLIVEGDYGTTSGTSADIGVAFPIDVDEGGNIELTSFTTIFYSMDLMLEINFFPYPHKKSEMNSYNISPFYFVGLGSKNFSEAPVISLPFGVGVKWKISDQWGFQFKFKVEKLFSDNFDGGDLDNPYQISVFDLHRQDWLYLTTVSLFYSFGQEVWDCHCNDESSRIYDKQ